MIALIASALLGLYVFVPYVAFHRICSLFLRLKKFQRTKTDEIVFGVVVAGLPFLLTLFLFWHGWIGGCCVPYPLVDSHQQKVSDYRTVFASVDSDAHFKDHEAETWDAAERVYERQVDFLSWNYLFLIAETGLFILLTYQYGKFRVGESKLAKTYVWFASRILLPAVSEWHILLTDFNFPPKRRRSVEVDILAKDNILYRGNVADHFLGNDGELTGLLLKDAQRFQRSKLEDDRKASKAKDIEEYWKPVAGGGNFYLPKDNIASLNVRYRLPLPEYQKVIQNAVAQLNLKGVLNVKVEAFQRCRCTNTRHGHEEPCNAAATENDQMCKPCHDKAAEEFGGTQQRGVPDIPPSTPSGS